MSPIKYEKKIEILERENDQGLVIIDSRKETKALVIDIDILSAIKNFLGI